jgi:hypothetical protein
MIVCKSFLKLKVDGQKKQYLSLKQKKGKKENNNKSSVLTQKREDPLMTLCSLIMLKLEKRKFQKKRKYFIHFVVY